MMAADPDSVNSVPVFKPFLKTALCFLALLALLPAPAGAASRCGAEGDWRSRLIPDIWPPPKARRHLHSRYVTIKNVPVYKACMAHDQCYDTPGADRTECDERFHDDIKAQCDRVYKGLVDAPLREACHQAAYAYYQAVDRYGEPTFMAAQKGKAGNVPVVAERPGPVKASTPARQNTPGKGKAQGAENELDWRVWGELPGVSGLAAYGKKLYAYTAASREVWVSPAGRCDWSLLGSGPPAEAFAAGAGRLYLAGHDGAIWVSGAGKLKWKRAGQLPGVAALAVCGGNLIAWQRTSGRLLRSSVFKLDWKSLGSAREVRDLAATHQRLIKAHSDGCLLHGSKPGKISWGAMGKAKAVGPLAAERNLLFSADPETGRVFSAQVR